MGTMIAIGVLTVVVFIGGIAVGYSWDEFMNRS